MAVCGRAHRIGYHVYNKGKLDQNARPKLMAGRPSGTLNTILLLAGFALWAYGFAYSSFWYANEGPSILEPLRVWVSEYSGLPIRPGLLEQFLGLCTAAAGLFMKLGTGYQK